MIGLLVCGPSAFAANPIATIWNAYDDPADFLRAFAPVIRSGDLVLAVEGNGGKPADPARAMAHLHTLEAGLVGRGIRFGLLTSDLGNVEILAKALKDESAVETLVYGYEPGYAREFPRGEGAGWDFGKAIANVRKAAELAHGAGKNLMVGVTGRALLERDLKKYGWNYARLLTEGGADLLLVQTQAWVRWGELPDALDVLEKQLDELKIDRDRVALQITIEPERIANENGVAPEAGYTASLEALFHGYQTISLWHAYRDLPAAHEYLAMIGRGPARAVPTFESVGLYWTPNRVGSGDTCSVGYRVHPAGPWQFGLPLWSDTRNGELRGSLVGLKPGTTYDVALHLMDGRDSATLVVTTWNESFPIAATRFVASGMTYAALTFTESGRPGAWVEYAPPPGSTAVIDVSGHEDACVTVAASYVVVHGLVARGGRHHGIVLAEGVHDVVIENCDISGWGAVAKDGFAIDEQGGIFSRYSDLARVVIQRNRIHDPRGNANDWTQKREVTGETYHPNGPQAIIFQDPLGNNVIRWNEVYADERHRFNDGIGGAENFSTRGFPGADSDVYGNAVSDVTDDALEIEGGGRNIRVWGNYMDLTLSGVASAACSLGPLYIFRNVMNRSREATDKDSDLDNRGPFGKLADQGRYAHGRRYFFHNTVLQPPAPPGKKYPLGAYCGPHPCGDNEPMSNTVSLNNIWNIRNPGWYFVEDGHRNPDNLLDYDLTNGRIKAYAGAEPHGLHGVPLYEPGQGDVAGRSGRYTLAPGSLGRDAGCPIPGFNDRFTGSAPDMGAQEAGDPPMRFGLDDPERRQGRTRNDVEGFGLDSAR